MHHTYAPKEVNEDLRDSQERQSESHLSNKEQPKVLFEKQIPNIFYSKGELPKLNELYSCLI